MADIELLQGPAGGVSKNNVNKARKRRAKKKVMEKNGPQIMDQVDDNLEASEKITDCKSVNNFLENNLLQTISTVQTPSEGPKIVAASTEVLSEVNTNRKEKNRKKKLRRKAKLKEAQGMDNTKMDTGPKENLVEGNVNDNRKRRKRIKKKAKNKEEIQSMDQTEAMLHLQSSYVKHGQGIDGNLNESEITVEESEFSIRKGSSLSVIVLDKGDISDFCKHDETIVSPEVVEVSSDIVSSQSVELLRPMEVDMCGNQHKPYSDKMVEENVKFENGLNDVNNESVVDQEQCSVEDQSASSPCCVELTTHPSPDVMGAQCLPKDLGQYPRSGPIASIKRKLLVLDVNGLLANIVMPAPRDRRGDTHILGRAIFKRPFCDDFLKFCFQNFDVGVWSSRSKRLIDRVVDYLLGDLKDQLLFCWDMDHSTQTGFKTLENMYKPLVCKELRKIWENDDLNLPWKKGDYNESNTLLLDDSPYKALLNPLHTAIFPNSYHYEDKNDNALGPGGDLRVYLEGLLASEDVQKYVEQHPFGQSAINETNLSWGFYSEVLRTLSIGNNSPGSVPISS